MLSQTNVQKSVWVCSYCLCPSLWGSQRNTSFLLPCPKHSFILVQCISTLSLSSSSSCSLRVVLAKIKEPIMKQSVFKLQKIARKREGGRTTIQCSSEEWAEIIVLISGPKSRCPPEWLWWVCSPKYTNPCLDILSMACWWSWQTETEQ